MKYVAKVTVLIVLMLGMITLHSEVVLGNEAEVVEVYPSEDEIILNEQGLIKPYVVVKGDYDEASTDYVEIMGVQLNRVNQITIIEEGVEFTKVYFEDILVDYLGEGEQLVSYSVMVDGSLKTGSHNMMVYENVPNRLTGHSLFTAGSIQCLYLKNDGSVSGLGSNSYNALNTSSWSNIVSVYSRYSLSIGLTSSGTVLITDPTNAEYSGFADGTYSGVNFKYLDMGEDVIAAVKSDGSALIIGESNDHYPKPEEDPTLWSNLKELEMGVNHIIGLKNDNTVIARRASSSGVYSSGTGVEGLNGATDIVDIEAGYYVGFILDMHGKAESSSDNYDAVTFGNLDNLEKVVQISCFRYHGLALLEDGTVVQGTSSMPLNLHNWVDMVYVEVTRFGAFGITRDGNILFESIDSENEYNLNPYARDIMNNEFSTYPENNSIVGIEKSVMTPKLTIYDTDVTQVNLVCNGEQIATTKTVSGDEYIFEAIKPMSINSGENYITYKLTYTDNSVRYYTSEFVYDINSTEIETSVTADSIGIRLATPVKDKFGENVQMAITKSGEQDEWLGIDDVAQKVDFNGLSTNTVYSFDVKIGVPDSSNTSHTIVYSERLYVSTLTEEITSIGVVETSDEMIKVTKSDSNPNGTLYQVVCDNRYVDETGSLTSYPRWITLDNDELVVREPEYNKNLGIRIRSKNHDNVTSDWSDTVYETVEKALPVKLVEADISKVISTDKIEISWTSLGMDVNYEIEVDGEIIELGYKRNFSHEGLKGNTSHSYRIRGLNKAGYGDWSDLLIEETTLSMPVVPVLLADSYVVEDTKALLIWEKDTNVDYYEVELNGFVLPPIEENYYEAWGLSANTPYNFSIKGVNSLGASTATSGSFETKGLQSPEVGVTDVTDTSITLDWEDVVGASEYVVSVNGVDQPAVLVSEYLMTSPDVVQNAEYTFTVKAVGGSDESRESDELVVKSLPTRPSVISEIYAISLDKSIQILWNGLTGLDITGYDVEADGILLEHYESNPADQQVYIHSDIDPFSEHVYRIRARKDIVEGEWSSPINATTLPGTPLPPKGIKVSTVGQVTTITWDEVPEALGYEVYSFRFDSGNNVSENTVEYVNEAIFVDRGIELGSEYFYQIRVINKIGESEWSGCIVNNSLKVMSSNEEELDYNATASSIVDFSPFMLNVHYNADVLEVKDLCGKTGLFELEAGYIEEEGITIESFEPGKIVFTVDKEIELGTMWTGIVNNIVFEGQIDGGTTIDYTVEIDKSFEIAGMEVE